MLLFLLCMWFSQGFSRPTLLIIKKLKMKLPTILTIIQYHNFGILLSKVPCVTKKLHNLGCVQPDLSLYIALDH